MDGRDVLRTLLLLPVPRRRRPVPSVPVLVIREPIPEVGPMNAKLKTRFTEKPIVIGDAHGGLWIECEIVDPPSSAGRTVDLHVDASQVTDMLLEFRARAIEQRSVPEHG